MKKTTQLLESMSSRISKRKWKLGLVQLNTGEDMKMNMEVTSALIRKCAEEGADLVVTPENTGRMSPHNAKKHAQVKQGAKDEQNHPQLRHYRKLAHELNVHIIIGSLAVKLPHETTRVANRQYFISPLPEAAATTTHDDDSGDSNEQLGAIVQHYDKIHMFDVPSLDKAKGEGYMESERYVPGDTVKMAESPFGMFGLSICYDLRFPNLYRMMAQKGAIFLNIPAAFTQMTGEAHWKVLLRSRAIENGCFVFAAAQAGMHPGNRQTYGHSLVIDPWGRVLAELDGESSCHKVLDIDTDLVFEAREKIPSLVMGRELKF